ncbi:MAG: type II CAAX endopeptidase family protein [Calditrichia bacterium]|jgi:membrane protease YdiL (CAAX protease family)
MEEKSQFPRPLEAFLIIIASFFLIVLITQSLLFILVSDPEQINQNSLALKMLITFGEVGLIIVPLVYVKSRGLSYREVFRWNPIPAFLIPWGFAIGLGISVIGDELDRLMNMFIPAPDFLGEISQAMAIHTPVDFIILVFGAVVAAAFVEESIIRGFLQRSLEKHYDVTKAVIYASLAWTIIHGMIYWAIQIFLLGIILGILAWRANSIVPSVIGHATNNAAALLFYNTNQEKFASIYLWGDHVSPIILILGTAGLVFGMRAYYQYYGGRSETPFSPN